MNSPLFYTWNYKVQRWQVEVCQPRPFTTEDTTEHEEKHTFMIFAFWSVEVHYPTTFANVPIGEIVMRISSPGCSVNESGGTTPVPVSRKHPRGKVLLR